MLQTLTGVARRILGGVRDAGQVQEGGDAYTAETMAGGRYVHPSLDEAHLYFVRPDALDEGALDRLVALFDEDERARLERHLYPVPRLEFIATRALARLTLAAYTNDDPRALRFEANQWGRPRLAGSHRGAVHFNLTNTRGLVACIVGVHEEIGIDAEYLERASRTVEVADRFFSPDEVEALRAQPTELQRFTFFRYWTLKEAYIKARGMGLALPLSEFTFSLDEPSIGITFGPRIEDDPSSWRFDHVPFDDRHLVSTAVRAEKGSVRLVTREVSFEADWAPLLERWGY